MPSAASWPPPAPLSESPLPSGPRRSSPKRSRRRSGLHSLLWLPRLRPCSDVSRDRRSFSLPRPRLSLWLPSPLLRWPPRPGRFRPRPRPGGSPVPCSAWPAPQPEPLRLLQALPLPVYVLLQCADLALPIPDLFLQLPDGNMLRIDHLGKLNPVTFRH